MEKSQTNSGILRIEEMLRAEAAEVCGKEFSGQSGQALYRALNEQKLAALCISGGGIRSAAFALGVIQALAIHPRSKAGASTKDAASSLLSNFHYLSTVSGGGYIGSWLSSWIARTGNFQQIWENLTRRPEGPDAEPRMISWLRDHSNYLTPKLGLTSGDTWAAFALFMRNLLLNWLVIIPVLCFALLVLKWVAFAVEYISKILPADGEKLFFVFLALALACLAYSLQFTTRNRPTRGDLRTGHSAYLFHDLLPAIFSGVFVSLVLALAYTQTVIRALPCCTSSTELSSTTCLEWLALIGAGAGAVVYIIGWVVAWPPFRTKADYWGDLAAWSFSGGLYGAVMGVGVWSFGGQYVSPFWIYKSPEIILVAFAVPWALISQLFSEMIFVGLTSREKDSDSDREWLGRAAGWYLVSAVVWLGLMSLVFVGSTVAGVLILQAKTWLAPLGVSGVVTALLGKSSITQAKGRSVGILGLSANAVLAISAVIFSVALIVVASALLDNVIFGAALTDTEFWKAPVFAPGQTAQWPIEATWLATWTAIIVAIGLGAGWFINVNRFSLHALYRNRIIRAFLGGSNPNRRANPFTDFDGNDNLRMHELWPRNGKATGRPKVRSAEWRPFHVVNMALNITATDKLAWQQRKAESFIATPLHSGSAAVNRDKGGVARGGFRDSLTYGDQRGISVGTAVAISGAAASPNMGYHSSPPVALLMTLFNTRLGWWLGNPGPEGNETHRLEGPNLAFRPLLMEMLGFTRDDNKYIYLSDGGHFENLALYEMVRRRCRFIVLSDGGCDPEFAFEDLGNAVRKVSLDLGVTIDFKGIGKLRARAKDKKGKLREQPGPSPSLYAVGIINYPNADDGENENPSGHGLILYIKPTYHPDVIRDVGVRNYATANADFPHQATSDQWFDEPQFESYRALGFEMMDSVLGSAIAKMEAGPITLETVLEKLSEMVEAAPTL